MNQNCLSKQLNQIAVLRDFVFSKVKSFGVSNKKQGRTL